MQIASDRLNNLSPRFYSSLEGQIARLRAQGREVIRLDVGSPDLPPAPFIVEALQNAAAREDGHGYQSHRGTLELREAWAETYRRAHGVELDAESQVLPLMGTKEGIFHLTMAVVNPGDVVLIPDPSYLTYNEAARFAGAHPYFLPLREEKAFLPDLSSIPEDVLKRAKILWLNYPNNPTGATASLDFFAQAVAFAREHDLLLCHDAAYTEIIFGETRAPSVLEVPDAEDVCVEFASLSKTYNMAGWRVGAALGNAEALDSLLRLKSQVDSSHFLPVWQAAAAALTGDQSWIRERNEIYAQRRDLVVESLQRGGLEPYIPQAALYVWCAVPSGWRSADFAAALLEDSGVSVVPGTVFGAGGEGYIRIALTLPTDRLREAMQRMEAWLQA